MEKKAAADVRKPTRKRFHKSSAKAEGASAASQASSSSAGSSLASSRVSTPSITLSNTNSSSTTASCSNSAVALAVLENRLKYQYSREELFKLRDSPLAKAKPECLNINHEVEDGLWDPDLWISSFATSSGDAGSQTAVPREKRKTVVEGEAVARKRPNSTAVKQPVDNGTGEDDDEHIILGPQRGSFGTGCQVKRSSATNETRRGIGSGRIQITDRTVERDQRVSDRGSHDREETKVSYERRRIERDSEDGRMRFTRGSDENFSGRFSRDEGYRSSNFDRDRREDSHGNKNRFERDRDGVVDRNYERRKDGPSRGKSEYPERRDYDDRRGNKLPSRYSSRDGYSEHMSSGYSRSQAEPEWFTDGPKHQWDTIELGGFESVSRKDRSESSKSPSEENEENVRPSQIGDSRINESAEGGNQKATAIQKAGESRKTSNARKASNKISEAEENAPNRVSEMDACTDKKRKEAAGVTEPPDPSKTAQNKPELSAGAVVPPATTSGGPTGQSSGEFDFTMFLNDNTWLNASTSADTNAGSRFQRWFPGGSAEGRGSPRKEMSDNGTVAAPLFSLFGRISPSSQAGPMSVNIMDILQKSEKEIPELPSIYHRLASHDSPTHSQAAVDVAANVKALLESVPVPASQPVLPAGGKILMAEDLEASLLSPANEPSKSSGSEPGSRKLHHNHQTHGTAMTASVILHHGPSHGSKPPGPAPALPAGARVTTVEELEAGLRDIHVASSGGAVALESSDQPDLSAFQKLLGLVNRDESNAETNSGPVPATNSQMVHPPNIIHHQTNAGQMFGQQPRPAQPSVPLQKLFNLPPSQQMPSVPSLLPGFVRPPVMAAGHPPMLPASAVIQNSIMQPSMSPLIVQQLSPHASSPIMFGTQPPNNITAPLPIHRGQRPPFVPMNPAMPQFAHGMNQPSSHDAIQLAYIQNLLKQQQQQQLDEQRHMQMLQHGDRIGAQQYIANNSGNQQPSVISSAKLNSLSSIPTAVIRKMKVDEKLSKDGDVTHGAAGGRVTGGRDPTMPGMPSDGVVLQTGLPPAVDMLLKGKGSGAMSSNGPAGATGFGSVLLDAGSTSTGYQHLGHTMPDAAAIANFDQNRNGRRLVGQGLMFHGTSPGGVMLQQQPQQQPPVRTPASVQAAQAGRPIVKLGQQMPFSVAPPRTNGTLPGLPLPNAAQNRLMLQQQRAASVQQTSVTADGLAAKLPATLNQQQQQQLATALLLQQLQKGPLPVGSSSVVGQSAPPPGANVPTRPSNGGDAIARWFGPDVYGDPRHLPNMPGQRVMTLDEIECSASPPNN